MKLFEFKEIDHQNWKYNFFLMILRTLMWATKGNLNI